MNRTDPVGRLRSADGRKRSRDFVGAATALLSFLLLVSGAGAQQFRVFKPGGGADPQKAPHESPPFTHWDLRLFNTCTVPWVMGTAPVNFDFDGNGMIGGANNAGDAAAADAVLVQAFNAWGAVTPSKLVVSNVGPVPPVGGNFAMDSYNTVSFSSTPFASAGTNARTMVWRSESTGVISEVDIIFNDFQATTPGSPKVWVIRADGSALAHDVDAAPTGNFPGAEDTDWDGDMVEESEREFRTIATHEIGHFMGLGHIFPLTGFTNVQANDVMERSWKLGIGPQGSGNANHTLGLRDQDGMNFLYTPDLGDAPHIDGLFSTTFSTKVHGANSGSTLNGQPILNILAGPMHKLGRALRLATRNFTYEWIGTGSGSDITSECTPNSPDPKDDGVTFTPNPPICGQNLRIDVDVRTAADAYGMVHVYPFADPMFVNTWIDLNADQKWEEGVEHVINDFQLIAAGTASGNVTLPAQSPGTMWVRARLDWGELVSPGGFGEPGLSPDLSEHEGAAQFGEVEDYPLVCQPPPLAVELVSFEANVTPTAVILIWSTESEVQNEGFLVLRSTDPDGGFGIASPFVPALGGPAFGAEYEFVDDSVEPGVTYYYLLKDIDTSGVSTQHGVDACTFNADPDCEPLAVTVPGIAAAQFCGTYEIGSKSKKDRRSEERACKEADWRNNEGRHPRDCMISKGSRKGSKGSRATRSCMASADAD